MRATRIAKRAQLKALKNVDTAFREGFKQGFAQAHVVIVTAAFGLTYEP